MASLIVEGWRFLPHSYAVVNQFQLLEMVKRPNLEIFHRDLPFFRKNWQKEKNLFPEKKEAILKDIPAAGKNQTADAVFRMSFPYDLEPNNGTPTFIFGTSEFGTVTEDSLLGSGSLKERFAVSDIRIITPSHWSRQGFIRSGALPDRVSVVPHGVDINIFKPLPESERQALRRQLGWNGYFVFLHAGAMTRNKGIHFLLKSLAATAQHHPNVRLVLKGLDSLYMSEGFVRDITEDLSEKEKEAVLPRIVYSGNTFSFLEMAQLYQAADAYVSPYMAEGFNMPVLEAMACGLAVICTKGGPTDEFTSTEFVLGIESDFQKMVDNHQVTKYFLYPDQNHIIEMMNRVIENPKIRDKANRLGPSFVASRFTWKHVVDKLLEILLQSASI